MKPETIVICTGGFDPIHEGHLAYFDAAKRLGDILLVGVNSDDWLKRKKGYVLLSRETRVNIIGHLRMVDGVFDFDDSDDTALDAISRAKILGGDDYKHYIFANGGDRTEANIPEMAARDVEFVFGVGGYDKKNSSSELVKKVKNG